MAELFDGHVAPGFEGVAETFAAGLKRREEWGAGLCVWHDGAVVVDVWGAAADRKRAEPWAPDTMATVFSVTKGLAALCFLMLADRGELDYDAPVARYWPEFGVDGKETITVRMVLNHASGLIGLAEPIDLDDLEHRPERVAEVLAMSQPRWEPGTDQGYHAITYGLYAQEIFRRITGETLGSFLAREVAGPLGADVYLGLPEELEPRVATTYPATTG